MQYALVELKEQETWLRNYHSRMLQMVLHRIDSNRTALKALENKGYKAGKLNPAKGDQHNSFTYNQSGFKIEKHGNTDLLWLSKIGYVQIRLHRRISYIKQITIIRRIRKWYAVICCEIARPIFRLINPQKVVGIDVGIAKLLHDSDNNEIENPLFLKKMLRPLRRASRRLTRREKGSKNRKKAKTRLQVLHEKIRNQRLDFLHKISTSYSKKYDVIFMERLRILNLVRNSHVARYMLDSGWNTFGRMLNYKSKLMISVEPYNTSVDCSRCGNKVPKSLAVRIHTCERCGLVIDRDYNASLNILQRGLLMLPQGLRELTPVEIRCGSRKQEQTIGQLIGVHFKYRSC
jgi:putative transposase